MDIQEIIKNRYKELPADIQQAIKSNDLAGKFNSIAEKHNLHIDQNGALQTETLLVMLGLEPTSDYINNIERNLEITRTEAASIAADVNNDILSSIKNSLREMQGEQETETNTEVKTEGTVLRDIAPPTNLPTPNPASPVPNFAGLEKAGQFSIEKPAPTSSSSQYKSENINKEALLKSIEDKPEPAAIPMVDHLLTAHVNTPENIEVKKIEMVEVKPLEQKPVIEAKKSYTADPYREQF